VHAGVGVAGGAQGVLPAIGFTDGDSVMAD